jgi:hypothetical protein
MPKIGDYVIIEGTKVGASRREGNLVGMDRRHGVGDQPGGRCDKDPAARGRLER